MLIISSFYFFFFKQKTAYEMRISDWSSDVCSSDLIGDEQRDHLQLLEALRPDADDEAEQAEGHRHQQHETGHQQRMRDLDIDEQMRGRKDDRADDDRLGRRGADIGDHHFRSEEHTSALQSPIPIS